MTILLVPAILLPALIAMVLKARTAFMWVWTSAALGLILGAIWLTFRQVENGSPGGAITALLLGEPLFLGGTDVYYFAPNTLYPSLFIGPLILIGILHLIPAHPRRARTDLVLFWIVVALLLALVLQPHYMQAFAAMPRRYVDYPEAFAIWNRVTNGLLIATAFVVFLAALRPLRSWYRSRTAR